MYTLVYPAVLGALLFSLFSSLTISPTTPGKYETLFAIFLILYFSSQHIENSPAYESYNGPMFFSDALEIVAMFSFYILLGIVDTDFKIDGDEKYTWGHFFFILSATLLLPVVARWWNQTTPFEERRSGWLSFLSIAAASISFSGILVSEKLCIIVGLFIILSIYFAFFVFEIVKLPNNRVRAGL